MLKYNLIKRLYSIRFSLRFLITLQLNTSQIWLIRIIHSVFPHFLSSLTKKEHNNANHNKNNPMTTRKMVMGGLLLSAGKEDVTSVSILFESVTRSVAGFVIGSVTGSV